jgi:hypothetical protein
MSGVSAEQPPRGRRLKPRQKSEKRPAKPARGEIGLVVDNGSTDDTFQTVIDSHDPANPPAANVLLRLGKRERSYMAPQDDEFAKISQDDMDCLAGLWLEIYNNRLDATYP